MHTTVSVGDVIDGRGVGHVATSIGDALTLSVSCDTGMLPDIDHYMDLLAKEYARSGPSRDPSIRVACARNWSTDRLTDTRYTDERAVNLPLSGWFHYSTPRTCFNLEDLWLSSQPLVVGIEGRKQ